DGDVLCVSVRRGATVVDRFHSDPEYFGDPVSASERGALAGRPEAYADLLAPPATPASVRRILDAVEETGPEPAMERLARCFGLRNVVSSYEYLENGE